MEVKEGLQIAFRAIRANIMRSVLTTLGIVIGIVSVTLMATAIEGVDIAFEESVKAFGSNILYIQKFPWLAGEDWWKYRNRKNLKLKYIPYLKENATLIDAVVPTVGTIKDARFGSRLMLSAFVTGTTHEYQIVSGTTINDGRFFSQEESDGGRPVCIIGANVAEELFPGITPIGQPIKVGGHTYQVLGVFQKQGGLFGIFTSDNQIFIPIYSFMNHFGTHRDITIYTRVTSDVDVEEAKEELRGLMRKLRGLTPNQEDDFSINQQELLTQVFSGITIIIAGVGFFITGLSLFVGGIGIMNIMFVSVTERTKEIGIRKALGAKRRTILLQFLIEAISICCMGGFLGLIIAYPLSLLANQILPTAMPVTIVIIALLVALFVGIVAGIIPAYRASRLNPVDALRYE